MNFKKLLYHLALYLLTCGASLIIGLLSFGGFFALWPVMSLASIAFVLSVAYEGEIYYQNIKGALSKLFEPDYLPLELARATLLNHFPHDLAPEKWPGFFVDYANLIAELHTLEHEELSVTREQKKDALLKKRLEMHQQFAEQLNAPLNGPFADNSEDAQALRAYLKHCPITDDNGQVSYVSLPEQYQALLQGRKGTYRGVQVFSALAALFMGFGTTYLLVETFTIVPFLATIPLAIWPVLIVPMAAISGLAYGLLTYNTVTSMIANDTLRTRFNALRQDFKLNGLTLKNGLMASTAVALLTLSVALTLCTAGTWWTIVQETRPLFGWMRKIPPFVMGVLTPLITGLSALAFNLENSSESLDMIEEATQDPRQQLREAWLRFKTTLQTLWAKENTLQFLNPFRLLLAATITPVVLTLFFGHLVSIGLTANRVPGFSAMLTSLLNIFSELFEDLHYFIKFTGAHKHDLRSLLTADLGNDPGHNHEDDMPTKIIRFATSPIVACASVWAYAFSQLNPPEHRLTFNQAFWPQPVTEPVTLTAQPTPKIPQPKATAIVPPAPPTVVTTKPTVKAKPTVKPIIHSPTSNISPQPTIIPSSVVVPDNAAIIPPTAEPSGTPTPSENIYCLPVRRKKAPPPSLAQFTFLNLRCQDPNCQEEHAASQNLTSQQQVP